MSVLHDSRDTHVHSAGLLVASNVEKFGTRSVFGVLWLHVQLFNAIREQDAICPAGLCVYPERFAETVAVC